MESDKTCYCSIEASKYLGPSEPEIIQNFGYLVEQLSLESIREVAECRPLRFQTGIVLTVPADVANATQEELDQIGQTFVDAYNQQSQQEGFCDDYFRTLLNYQISRMPSGDNGFTVIPAGNEPTSSSSGRMLAIRTSFQPKRRVQGVESLSPSFAPSVTPSINWENASLTPVLPLPVSSDTSIFLEVTGLCQGCTMDVGLFDQVSARRQLQDDKLELVNGTSNGTATNDEKSCFCPPNTTRLQLSEKAVTNALSSLPFVNGTVGLSEVEVVDCSVEVNSFETTVPLDFLVNGDIVQADSDYIATGFMTTYKQLSDEYCDSLFRRPDQVVSTNYVVTAGPDQNDISTVRFWLDLQGTCRGCTGSESLFGANRRRMQESDVCYCKKDAVSRAPSDAEFQRAFDSYLGSNGRRLQQQSKFTLLCVGSSCSPDALLPSMSPTSIVLVNPLGAQNFATCNAPDTSFVGDGYCDRTLDANGLPVFNNVQCGYDGGDW
jgi:hypothetical protein